MPDLKFQLQQLATDFSTQLSGAERLAAKNVSKPLAKAALIRADLAEERAKCYRAINESSALCPRCWISSGSEVHMLRTKVDGQPDFYLCFRYRDTYVLEK